MVAYSTPKLQKFAGANWLCVTFVMYMLLCISTVPLIVVLREEDYDISDQIESVVSVKVYGTVKSNFSEDQFKDFISPAEREMYNRLWDPADYVFPQARGQPSEVFIATNMVIKQNQTKSRCPEDPDIKGANCDPSDPKPCQGYVGNYGGKSSSGIPTGKCLPVVRNNVTVNHTCEVEAWCPIIYYEDIPLKHHQPLLRNVNESVLIISTSIRFPQFNYSPLPETQYRNYKMCDSRDPHCPPWKLGEIISTAHVSKPEEEVYKYGAVLALHVHWDDCIVGKLCNPVYVPTDFKNPDLETYYFHTYVYKDISVINMKRRTLVKAYGVRLVVLVSGTAKKWDWGSFLASCAKYGSLITLANMVFAYCLLSVCYRSCSWRNCYSWVNCCGCCDSCCNNEGRIADPYSEVYPAVDCEAVKVCRCLCTAITNLKDCITCSCGRKKRQLLIQVTD